MAHDPLPPLLSTLQTLLLTSNVPDTSLPSAPSVQNTMDTLQPMASTLETLLPREITNVQPQNAETVVPEPGSIVPQEPANDPLHSLFSTIETLLTQEITNGQAQNTETVVGSQVDIVPQEPANDPLRPLFSTLETLLRTTRVPVTLLDGESSGEIEEDIPEIQDAFEPTRETQERDKLLESLLVTLKTMLTSSHEITNRPEPHVLQTEDIERQQGQGQEQESGIPNRWDGISQEKPPLSEIIQLRTPRARSGEKPADAVEVAKIQFDTPENSKIIWFDTQNQEIYNNDAPLGEGANQ
jgi:hypothetical protein